MTEESTKVDLSSALLKLGELKENVDVTFTYKEADALATFIGYAYSRLEDGGQLVMKIIDNKEH